MVKIALILKLSFIIITASCQDNCLITLEDFADNFIPSKNDSSVIPNINIYQEKNWNDIIEKAYKIDSIKTNKYISLVLLKLYKSHLECCKQAYTLPLTNPFVNYFLKINGFYESETVNRIPKELIGDMIWSSIVYDWLHGEVDFLQNNYKNFINDGAIKQELSSIDRQLKE